MNENYLETLFYNSVPVYYCVLPPIGVVGYNISTLHNNISPVTTCKEVS
jgi:hypothetical protein